MMTWYSISQNKGKHFSEGGEIEEEEREVGWKRVGSMNGGRGYVVGK